MNNHSMAWESQWWMIGINWQDILVGGWATPLKKYECVNWDDEIPNNTNIWENKIDGNQTTNQYYWKKSIQIW